VVGKEHACFVKRSFCRVPQTGKAQRRGNPFSFTRGNVEGGLGDADCHMQKLAIKKQEIFKNHYTLFRFA